MGRKLAEIWKQSNQQKSLKVRYINWDHRTKYFEIHDYSEDLKKFVGKLDCGEEISFSPVSDHWVLYEDNIENDLPRAV